MNSELRWERAVQNGLERFRPVKRARRNHWELQPVDEFSLPLHARVRDGWLLLETPLSNGDMTATSSSSRFRKPLGIESNAEKRISVGPSALWSLLQYNGELRGGVKFALGRDQRRIKLQAEIALVEGMDMDARLSDACLGFNTALTKCHGVGEPAKTNERTGCLASAGDLMRLCQETNWPFVEHSTGRMHVGLETPDGFYQAGIESRHGRVHAETEIACVESPGGLRGHALAVLFLATSGVVRMARAAAAETDGRCAVRLEVVFDRCPSAQELGHALSALSVGCRIAGREAELLQEDEKVAREYLSLWSGEHSKGVNSEAKEIIDGGIKSTEAPSGAGKGDEVWTQQ